MPCSQERSQVLLAPSILPVLDTVLISLLNWVLLLLRGWVVVLPLLDSSPSGAGAGGAVSLLVFL